MTAAEHNRALVERLLDIINEGQLEAIEEVASGEIAAAAAGWIGPFRESFPDFHMELVRVVADDETVMAHFKCSGTHRGEWRGHAPTGRRFEDVDEIYTFQVEHGKLSRALAVVEDNLTRLRQLGLQP